MVKIKKSSDELNRFLSRVYISPGHAASFTGLDKLYCTVKNQFLSVTHYTNPTEEPSNKTRCMLLKFYGKLIWLLYNM